MSILVLLISILAFLASATTASQHASMKAFKLNPLLGIYNHPATRGRTYTNLLSSSSSSTCPPSSNPVTTSIKAGFQKAMAVHTVQRGGGGGRNVLASPLHPPKNNWLLAGAYSLTGLATTAAWSYIVYTTIRSNQPVGAMMPTWQHGFYARIGALSAVPIFGSTFYMLARTAKTSTSWEEWRASSSPFRRHNLALATAGLGSALWVGFAPLLTKIPGTEPLLSHQAYKGVMRLGLIGCYSSAAVLSAAVWASSLPDNIRKNPLKWPGHVADGVCKSLVSLAIPADRENPVNVKYAFLASSFLVFTGLQLGSHPLSVIPSWTGRRLARHFPVWTLLGLASSLTLKEAVENDTLDQYKPLAHGLKGFGIVYLAARVGAVFLDPSWPESYHAVIMVPGWATAAILMIGMTLRSDKVNKPAMTCERVPEPSVEDEDDTMDAGVAP